MTKNTPQIYHRRVVRVGGWLPQNHETLTRWLHKKVHQVRVNAPPRLPVVQDLADLIDRDPEMYMLFTEMLRQVPRHPPYRHDPSGRWAIRTVEALLSVLDQILTEAPAWNGSELIGTPINAALCWPMATTAGFAAFLDRRVNAKLRAMLDYWHHFLASSASCSTLTPAPGGWFSAAALQSPHMQNFAETYECEPDLPHWGYTSWDDFFTRRFRPGLRPLAAPTDDSIIVSAAEATPFCVQTDVKLRDSFWLKGQPYSLAHMMNNDPRAERFVGGTVYQAFLSADTYHRWHAPVSGKIVSHEFVPGTYFSEPLLYNFDSGTEPPDPGAPNASQGYITAVATRALIWIEADNADVGLVCLVLVGMAEVSSIEIAMPDERHFEKGAELGMFHFGGSTCCLVFGPGVRLDWSFPVEEVGAASGRQVLVGAELARVRKRGVVSSGRRALELWD